MNMKMKKSLFFLAVAAVALAACSSDDTTAENSKVGNNQQKEIAFKPLTTPQTRSALHGTTLTNSFMYVAAYQAAGEGAGFSPAIFFGKKTFKQDATTSTVWRNWNGSAYAPIFWPLSSATINFLAVTGNNGTVDINSTPDFVTFGTYGANSVDVNYTSGTGDGKANRTDESQIDIMYAVGQGIVSHAGINAGGSVTSDVAMPFNHALALLTFQVKAKDAATQNNIKINSITINGAYYTGTLTVTNSNYDKNTTAAKDKPTIAWVTDAAAGDGAVAEIGSGYTISNTDAFYPSNTAAGSGWWQKMIIPTTGSTDRGLRSFTINYTVLDENNHTYNYIYYPQASNADFVVAEGKVYNFQITFALHEIRVQPSVTDWASQAVDPVTVPSE
jgi:hypothetical protein